MKKLIPLPLLPLLALLAVDALGQQSNPLRITCPPNLTNWVCEGTSTAPVTYPAPTTTGSCPTNATVTCSPASGSTFILGPTTVTCRATNSCRESAVCSFTVTVARDTTPPVIQCPTNRIVWICGTASTTPVTFPLPTATDNADTNVAVSCSRASGSNFAVGTTTVICTATDDCTNRTTCTFTVTVNRDTTPPVIQCPSNITVWACSASGAVVTYLTPTATDNADTNVAVTCSPASGTLFPVGNTTVTCTATDDCINRTTCTFTVTVARDTTPPVIQCPTNRTVWTCSPTGTVVNFNTPAATDNFDATPTVVCSPPSGSVFPLGVTPVVCTATDNCGNRSNCTFTVMVRPPLIFDGLCHSPLGLAALNVNTSGELEISNLGTSGQDGVRIDLGESQGLRWLMKHPPGQPTGDMEVQVLGKATTGNEVLLSRMSFAYGNGRVSVTPVAASYEFKLLLNGVVVHRRSGQSGSFNLPVCSVVWEPGPCWEDPPFFDHPFLPFCMSFLGLVCPVETDGGPVLADTVVVTPEDPMPPFTSLTGVQILGRNLPVLTLHRERLLMFGSPTQAPLPHLALGQARLVAENGALAVANLGSSGQDGVRVELGESSGLRWRMKNPVGNPEGDMDIDVIGRTTAGTEVPVRRISHQYRNGRLSVTPGTGSYELKLLRQGQVVFLQGGRTGAVEIPSCQHAEIEVCVGEPFAGWIPHVPYCMNVLTIECNWETPAGPVLADTLVLTPEDPLPPLTAISAVQILGRNIRNLPALTLLDERRLTFGGSELRLACPSNLTVRTCSTNPAPVTFPFPMVTGANCWAPPVVVCVPPSGSLFPPGTTTVTCTATNVCGERGVCNFTVTVLADIVPPAIQCPTNVSVFTANAAGRLVYYAPLVMTDDSEANVSCVPSSGSLFPVGITPVVCTARDACGHERSCTFTVEVTLLTLRVSPGASGPLLSWTGGAMLEAADEVTGPWLPVRDARSPYLIQFLGAKKFFRLAAPPGDADCGEVVFSPSVWNIDVPAVRIQGRFLLNSRPFPSSFLQGANFFLRRVSTGDEVYLGLSNNDTFDRRVVPGIYDVIYEHKIGDEVPLNTVAVLIAGLEISGDQAFDIDVPMVGISGAFTLQGAAFPNSVNESGVIQARDSQTGLLTALGETTDQAYSARLIPGTYDLLYSHTSGNIVPANVLTAFRRNVPIVISGPLNMDVPKISVTGNFTVNGVLTPGSVNESGWIFLLDPDTGAKLLLGATDNQHYQRVLIPGAYDVLYERISGSSVMPANSSARFLTGLQLVADGANDINLPVVEISGDFLVNGAPAPAFAVDNAKIRLRHGEDTVYLGQTKVGHFSVLVIPGTYNVNFESLSSGNIMPANTNAVLGAVVIAGATVFDINIPTANYAADVRFNGGNFPGPIAGESARLFLEDTLTGGLVPLAFSYPTSDQVSRLVVRGNYRVRYAYESGTTLPRNTFATLGSSLTVTQNVQTVIDVRAVALSGNFRLNGGAFPGAQNAAITVRSLLPGDSLYLGGTQSGTYATVIVPGHYAAFYNWAVGDLIPRNQNARLVCPR